MPADETTPLITIVQIRPSRPRYRHQTLRRTCTILLSIVLVFASLAAIFLFSLPDCDQNEARHPKQLCLPHHPFSGNSGERFRGPFASSLITQKSLTAEEVRDILLSTPDESKLREWSAYYTSGPHVAGKNLSQAQWTQDRWNEFGIPHTEIVPYDVYINYPVGHRLALLEWLESQSEHKSKSSRRSGSWRTKFEARLKEEVIKEDPTSGLEDRIPTFHAYSATGNVTARFVYVNYGTYQDFEDLVKQNVTLSGNIAVARYGKIFRGLKVKRAQELGMVGAIIYSDPGDDRNVTKQNGYREYPEGPARQPSSVQRGSTQYLSIAPGDPTTPGYPSKPGVPRLPPNASIPSIPSIPISYLDAIPILKALNGHGLSTDELEWEHGGLGYAGVEYSTGPSPENYALNLVNEQEYQITPIWNVIGVINGSVPDEVVIVGNHRDAWVAGGAGDPNSGSAALNEVARGLGEALSRGWQPLRTIVLASWDGEEYGLLGSTEWVEEYIPWLSNAAVAYINVDTAVMGPRFKASASPVLDKILIDSAKLVDSPARNASGMSIYDEWDKHISTIGSGSDFTAFQDFAGISSIALGFSQTGDSPVYHYHSNFDSFHWMETFGDPGFHYHAAVSKLLGAMLVGVSEAPIVPFNATDYASELLRYLDDVKEKMGHKAHDLLQWNDKQAQTCTGDLETAIKRMLNAAAGFDGLASELRYKMQHNGIPWWKWWERARFFKKVQMVNTGYKQLERGFLHEEGLDGRSWYKHVVFAPGLWTGYSGATFPGLVESIEKGDGARFCKWARIIAGLVKDCEERLRI